MKEIFLQLVLLLVCIWINSYHHSRKCHNFDIKGRYNILYSTYIREYMKCSYNNGFNAGELGEQDYYSQVGNFFHSDKTCPGV